MIIIAVGSSSGEVWQAKPAVVYLQGLDKAGSGFFVTGTGIIVTNAHVARGEESLLAMLSTGEQIEARVVYIDAELDIALAEVDVHPRISGGAPVQKKAGHLLRRPADKLQGLLKLQPD